MSCASMKLYWVTTEYHSEDCFVVANSPEEAATFHKDAEGYMPVATKVECKYEGKDTEA